MTATKSHQVRFHTRVHGKIHGRVGGQNWTQITFWVGDPIWRRVQGWSGAVLEVVEEINQ